MKIMLNLARKIRKITKSKYTIRERTVDFDYKRKKRLALQFRSPTTVSKWLWLPEAIYFRNVRYLTYLTSLNWKCLLDELELFYRIVI